MKKIIYICFLLFISFSVISCNLTPTVSNTQKVISLIEELPDQISLEDEEKINEIELLYQNLTENEKLQITNISKFENALQTLNILQQEEAKKANALVVVELINNLPSEDQITIEHLDQTNYIRNLYNNLTEEEKTYVTNFSYLLKVESIISNLKLEAIYQKEAKEVIDLINNLPPIDELTVDDENAVEKVRIKYGLLSIKAKPYVTNLSTLEQLEVKLEELLKIEALKVKANVVNNLINLIPGLNDLTLEHENSVYKAYDEYLKLTEDELKYVTNLEHLLLAKAKIDELMITREFRVYYHLFGGTLDGATELYENENVTSLSVNYYSQSFFTYPEQETFIYKSSLITSDTFTYAYKIGFSYDSALGKYVVKQVIKNEVPLTVDNKLSEYYILVHVSNSLALKEVAKIDVGNYITIDKNLPNEATSNLNATLKITKETTITGYYQTFIGSNQLLVPHKNGYIFMGWYEDENFINGPITYVTEEVTLYAKWLVDTANITTQNILNCVSDEVSSNTLDNLILKNEDATFTWKSSNDLLYSVNDGIGKTSKIYQTHKNQKVTISVLVKYNNGDEIKYSKEITILPVTFNELPNTPVATYFYTGAVSAYKKYNERYKNDGTLFSEDTKNSLDIVYYAFIMPDSSGNVTISNSEYLDEVRKLKAYDVRIIGCVNGVGSDTSQAFKTITESQALRTKFINNLMNMVEQYNFDGLDIDWEAVNSTIKPVAANVNLLIKELKAEMEKRQAAGGTPYFLSMAIPASSYGTASDRFDFKTLNNYVDYFNIMSYDLNNPSKTTHLSPLYKSTKDSGYGFSADYGISRLTSLGVSLNKLIIGCAGYGKAYKVTGSISSTYPGLGVSGTLTRISGVDGSFDSGTVYGSAIAYLKNTGKYVEYTEKTSSGKVVGSYLFNKSDKIFITYDSYEAVYAKYQYADSYDGVGIMCWAYTEDTSDIVINAITEAIKNKNN